MSVTLGGVTLNSSVQFNARYRKGNVIQGRRRTLAGTLIQKSVVIESGLPITLEATEETGWFSKAMVDSLLSLAASPSTVYTLSFFSNNYSVLFDFMQGDALDFTPLLYKQTQDSEGMFTGTVYLITA